MRQKACGLDILRKYLLAAVIDKDGPRKNTGSTAPKPIPSRLKDWVTHHGCEVIGCESTSDYWVQVYDLLEGQIAVVSGNA